MSKLHRAVVILCWLPMAGAVVWGLRGAYFTVGVHAPAAEQAGVAIGIAVLVIIALGIGVAGTSIVWALTAPSGDR